ncbi:SDR family oxidoreductase [Aerococcaceae bacterium zg-B36]|uniref:SDR family oxidoreductase n=1 Tax=Aerococcaceae bacterium zg-252 TaxID=2796928 RepID=UPI001BD8BC9D|nr:SDR family oxidoreductase [Aerococcaceae bacterium zg-B36]
MTNYLITGATGGYGSAVIRELSKSVPKENIIALVRSKEKGAALSEAGYPIRIADFNQTDALAEAMHGIDKVLLVSTDATPTRQQEHKNVIQAATDANVKFIAYTSLAQADSVAANFPLGDDHRATEQALAQSRIAYTSLRNNWYLENELDYITNSLKTGKFINTTPENSVAGWVSRDDLAEAGANILLADNPPAIVELSGKNRSYQDIVAAVNKVLGTNIAIVSDSQETLANALEKDGMPSEVASLVASFQGAVGAGFLKAESSDLESILGRPQTSLVDSLKKLLG